MPGGAAAAMPRPPARGRGRRQHQQATSLPFDVMVDIAARTDPATLYVLLVGSGDSDVSAAAAGSIIGRPFQLLLAIQTFSSSSEDLDGDGWGAFTEIRIPNLYGTRLKQDLGRHLVVGGAVHWLCLTDAGSYVIKLHVKSAQVTMVSELPETFPCDRWQIQHLLATTSPGGSPVVLVNDVDGKVSAWSQSKQTFKWKQRPQLVVDRERLVRFAVSVGGRRPHEYYKVRLHWFAERSGVVLVEIQYCGFFWVDLRTMEIVRWFSDPLIEYATVCCPYEIDLSSWVPTFSSTI
ncbi:hypothetical protein QOZ80_7BG0611680 [Eleusine coracana subsp. coracana]|nr:hypothetical protein QOZ80_7BG0611680 [Eleusine coracana subsp. coracana]